jgi:quercetin dioxygenase-like cupin family protein
MNKSVRFFVGLQIAGGALLGGPAMAQLTGAGVMARTPVEMKWEARGALARNGIEETNLVGDPAKPGPYTLRLKFPPGYKLPPHTHPDAREVTILSGTLYTAYWDGIKTTALKELPAGSFYTEPANVIHVVEAREPTLIQVSGIGPSGRRFINPDDNNQK